MTNSRELAEQVFEKHRREEQSIESLKEMLTDAVEAGKKEVTDTFNDSWVVVACFREVDPETGFVVPNVSNVWGPFATKEIAQVFKQTNAWPTPEHVHIRRFRPA